MSRGRRTIIRRAVPRREDDVIYRRKERANRLRDAVCLFLIPCNITYRLVRSAEPFCKPGRYESGRCLQNSACFKLYCGGSGPFFPAFRRAHVHRHFFHWQFDRQREQSSPQLVPLPVQYVLIGLSLLGALRQEAS